MHNSKTALHIVCENNHIEIVKLLRQQSIIDINSKQDITEGEIN